MVLEAVAKANAATRAYDAVNAAFKHANEAHTAMMGAKAAALFAKHEWDARREAAEALHGAYDSMGCMVANAHADAISAAFAKGEAIEDC
jgi:hypothetical protein